MRSFSINDIERFSGIKAHTFRTWEQRYGFPKPVRMAGRIRQYSLQELDSILSISLLKHNGFKISRLVNLSPCEIDEKLNSLGQDKRPQLFLKDLLVKMYETNIDGFEKVFNKCFDAYTDEEVVHLIILPFLQKAKLLWQGRRLTEEHFVVTTIRKKLILAIEKIEGVENRGKKVILFLPDTKQLDLALLYAHYYLKVRGVCIVYMGNDVSISNLSSILSKTKPDFLYTYLPQKTSFSISDLAFQLKQFAPNTRLVFTTQPDFTYLPHYGDNVIQVNLEAALSLLTDVNEGDFSSSK